MPDKAGCWCDKFTRRPSEFLPLRVCAALSPFRAGFIGAFPRVSPLPFKNLFHSALCASPSLFQRNRPRIGAARVNTVLSVLIATRSTVKPRIAGLEDCPWAMTLASSSLRPGHASSLSGRRNLIHLWARLTAQRGTVDFRRRAAGVVKKAVAFPRSAPRAGPGKATARPRLNQLERGGASTHLALCGAFSGVDELDRASGPAERARSLL